MEAWLKAAKLGPYDKDENWKEIVAKAKAEGEVVVYTSSGRIAKLVKPFAKIHPEIKVTVHDLGLGQIGSRRPSASRTPTSSTPTSSPPATPVR